MVQNLSLRYQQILRKLRKKAFFDIFYKSKMKPKSVLLCEKPLADAVGLGLDVNEPTGAMIVDIGADTTEISVISPWVDLY